MKYFKIEEFDFRGYGSIPPQKAEGKMNPQFLEMLDKAREYSGVPYKITSGYRPVSYDKILLPTWDMNVLSDHAQWSGCDIRIKDTAKMNQFIEAMKANGCSFAKGTSQTTFKIFYAMYPSFQYLDNDCLKIMYGLLKAGFARLGINTAKTHIHLGGLSSSLTQNAIWLE